MDVKPNIIDERIIQMMKHKTDKRSAKAAKPYLKVTVYIIWQP